MLISSNTIALAQDRPGAPVPLTLADAINRGFENSHRLAEIRAREEGARAAARSVELSKLPILSASAGYTRTNHVQEFAVPQPNGARLVVYPDIPNNIVTRVGFQWPIFTSGRTDALERAAAAEVSAVASEIETARLDLRFEIVRAYWAAVTAREAARVFDESVKRARAQLDDAQERFKVGLIPPNDVLSIESQWSRERAQATEAGNVYQSALVDLRRLTGAPYDAELALVDALEPGLDREPQSNLEGLIELAASRPEREAMRRRLEALEARQRAVAAANKPAINLIGGVDYANPNPRIFPRQGAWQESWDVGVQMNWNFMDFGRTKAQVAELAAGASATRARIAEFDAVVAADIEQRTLDLSSAFAVVEASRDAVKSATEARRVVGDRFAAGVATSTDLLAAQVAQLEAELMLTRSLASMRLAQARRQRSVGQAQ
jgi:outer membrane protein TolC